MTKIKFSFSFVLLVYFVKLTNSSEVIVNKCCPINQLMFGKTCVTSPLAENWTPTFAQHYTNSQYKFVIISFHGLFSKKTFRFSFNAIFGYNSDFH